MRLKAFVLTSFLKSHKGRSFLECSGTLETGNKFILYLSTDETNPFFYTLSNADNKDGLKNFQHKTVEKKTFATLEELRDAKYQYQKNQMFESDVDFNQQFFNTHGLNGSIEIIGELKETRNGTSIYYNNAIKKSSWVPRLKMFSFDLETNVKTNDFTHPSNDLYSISIQSDMHRIVLMWDPHKQHPEKEEVDDFEIIYCATEREILEKFVRIVQTDDANVFVGWNVVNFDFQFLIRKAQQLGVLLNIGCDNKPLEHHYSKNQDIYVKIAGKLIVDGMQLVKLQEIELPNYKLDTAAQHILNKNKTIQLSNEEKVQEIENLFNNNKQELARYNYVDSQLVYELFEKIDAMNYITQYHMMSGLPFDKHGSYIDLVEHVYLQRLHQMGYVAGDKTFVQTIYDKQPMIYQNKNGFFDNVVAITVPLLDAQILRFFCIDYFSSIMGIHLREESIEVQRNILFHPKSSVSSSFYNELFGKMEATTDVTLRKVLNNLILHYTQGILNRFSRFYSPLIYNLLFQIKQSIIVKTAQLLESNSETKVIFYEDGTLYVKVSNVKDFENQNLYAKVNEGLNAYLKEQYKIETSFYWERKDEHERMFVSKMRYALMKNGEIINKMDNHRFNIGFLKFFQDELLDVVFRGGDAIEKIKTIKQGLFEGKYDKLLVYKKKISKNRDNPTTPHMIAASKINENLLWVEYVITKKGADPVSKMVDPIDYDYYVDKYITHNVDEILPHTAFKDHANSSGKDSQMDLFSL